MSTMLLEDRYAPTTWVFGFLRCDAGRAADAFEQWYGPIQASRGVRLRRREVSGDLATRIESLLPLTSVEMRRYLFLPTKGSWTAFLDNGWRGTDAFSVVSELALRIGCEGIRAVDAPHTIRKSPTGEAGRSGATILEVYAADTASCSFLNIRRSVSVAYEGRCSFHAGGEPLEFEQPERYQARRVRDRFTPEVLHEYLGALGIRLCPDFFEVAAGAILISKEGPCAPDMEEYTFAEAQAD
jgi:hypothetical protein